MGISFFKLWILDDRFRQYAGTYHFVYDRYLFMETLITTIDVSLLTSYVLLFKKSD